MTLLEAIARGAVVADGATGTVLAEREPALAAAPATWALERPDLVERIHGEYADAGAGLLLACTFMASRPWLEPLGAGSRVAEANEVAVAAARRAARGRAVVAGSVGPLPLGRGARVGDAEFARACDAYAEQIAALEAAGADAVVFETMYDARSLRAALEAAARAAPAAPVVACMTFGASGTAPDGTTPAELARLAEAWGAVMVGANCCEGPESALRAVEALARATALPIWAKPSAGLPIEGAERRYPVGDAEFASWARRLAGAGARVVGGCCGTTPATVRAVARALAG